MSNPKYCGVCEHGGLARKCRICELEAELADALTEVREARCLLQGGLNRDKDGDETLYRLVVLALNRIREHTL